MKQSCIVNIFAFFFAFPAVSSDSPGIFRNSGRGEMFSAANVRKMNYIDYSFLALGIACLFIAPLTTGCAFYVIAILALFIDYILKLFMHTFVKGYRMKEEQELTI